MNTFLKTIVALLTFLSPVMATADPIVFENRYDDGVSVATAEWRSDNGTIIWRVWDTFTLTEDTEITRIDARAAFGGSPSLEFSIWTADRLTMLFSQVLSAEELLVSYLFPDSPQSDLVASLTGLQLAAGEYALSIWDMAENGSSFGWFSTCWESEGSSYQSLHYNGIEYVGGGTGLDMAFRLHGVAIAQTALRLQSVPVPEPGTFGLLSLGLAGLALSRRRSTAR